MTASSAPESRPWAVSPEACFIVSVCALGTAALTVLATPGYWAKPQVVAPALTVDLAIGMPALGYVFLVRGRRWSTLLLAPLLALGLGLVRWWIPAAHRDVSALKVVLVVLEVALTVFLALRVGAIGRRYRSHRTRMRPLDAMGSALRGALGGRLGGLIHTEISVLWYATSGWGRMPRERPGTRDFAYHGGNAYPALLAVILMMVVVETAVMHLLLGLWSGKAAWVSTALGLYSALWLIGDYHAARLNPISVTEGGLELTTGLRWRASVAWEAIRRIVDGDPGEAKVRMTLLGKPDFWLELREPVPVRGVFGIERRVRFLGLRSDDPGVLRAAIEADASVP